MSAECSSYLNADKVLVSGFSCPRAGGDARAVFCCGFQDVKYCCDDPHSFFPYEHSYMWWLRADLGGALSGAACSRCGCGKVLQSGQMLPPVSLSVLFCWWPMF
ncbi:protein shisa-like-2A isoform X3 [Onychostruthus taczanowskii]|uniref:protein shisa-like-2A isoform X3 n=1 Tax=Onychostruthus taczanowskii TaxID=356909 RepID=UPI001B80B93F|nr:protein shisa-like-2A isoform X3 [Onychostruthus taczanowskii]